MVRVSIITPSYNQHDFLETTILSVLNQDYGDKEYIVVDGGSTDRSETIIRRYAPRLSWWTSERDLGQADAINKGLQHASGEIVGWLNSDDIYYPGAISKVAEVFRSHPEAGLVYGDAYSIDENGKPFNIMKAARYDLLDMLSFHIICQPAVFMNRAILDRAGPLDLSYQLLLDHHLWIRMATLAPIIYVPGILAGARFHQDAKNRSRAASFNEETMRLLAWIETHPQLENEVRVHQRQIRAGAYRLGGFYQTEAGQPAAALASYWRSLRQYPSYAIRDWKHILLASLSLIGLQKLRGIYDRARTRRMQNKLTKHG